MTEKSTIGCSSRIVGYVDFCTLHTTHGRPLTFATGPKLARPELHVIVVTGDGDVASIGMAETIHTANRGEKVTVIFVNNAIYGMTGGQIAPTTLPGQVASTSPLGRDVALAGYPIRVVELLKELKTPAYLARVSVHDPKAIIQARKAIRTAFQHQVSGTCFSLVEILSTCPTGLLSHSL